MNDAWGIISLVLNLVLGSGGLWLWRETRRLKRAEAQQVETNNAIAIANEWQEVSKSKDVKLDQKDAKIDSMYILLSKVRDRCDEKDIRIHELELKIISDSIRLCNKRGCAERDPPTGF